MSDSKDSKLPVVIALGMIVAGLAIAAVGGFASGSIFGGALAGGAAIPGLYGMWKGVQQETQGTLAMSVVVVMAALCAGGLLIVLRVIHWVR